MKDVKDDAKDDEVVSNFSESLLPSDIDDLSRPVTPKNKCERPRQKISQIST